MKNTNVIINNKKLKLDHNDVLNQFNIKLPYVDNIIEKLLTDILISDDLTKNEKKLINIFINNAKKTNFSGIKLLYIISFINSVKKLIDNIEGDDFKKQLIIKGLSYIISTFTIELGITEYTDQEDFDIDELLSSILNVYSEKISFKILNNIEKNNNHDIENIKYQYQTNIQLILKLNHVFVKVVYHYIKLVNYMFTLYLIPVLYDSNGLTVLSFFRTTLLNVYSLILFNTIYKKCELKCKDDDKVVVKHEDSIEYFFSNLDKIVEGNNGDLKKELFEVSRQLFKFFEKPYLKKTFKFVYFGSERRRQTKLYNLLETIISLIVNNTYLLLGSDKFKTYFDGFSNNKIEFKELLKTSDHLIDILGYKKYEIKNIILWDKTYNYEYAFTLKNVSLEYKKDTINSTDRLSVIKDLSLDFEIYKFHFIYGDSGCGKTTLLKIMLQKEKIISGEVKFLGIHDNYNYLGILKHILVISSDSKLFPKSLYENMTYKINKKLLKSKYGEIMKDIIKYMNLFGLELFISNLKSNNSVKMSKGQIQKVNIIYSILNIKYSNTKILFLDEVTSNIDLNTEKIIFNELVTLYKTHPFTMFYISHNLSNLVFSDYSYHVSFDTQTVTKKKTNQNEI